MTVKENNEVLERALQREKAARKMAEDLLEKKASELYLLSQELKKSNEKLEKLLLEKTSELEGVFLNINDAHVVVDLYGNVQRMNDKAVELLGHQISDGPLSLLKLVHNDHLQYTLESFRELFKKGSFANYLTTITTKDNKEKRVRINATVIYDRFGKPIGAQGVARDVTKDIELNNLLETQKKQLDLIFDNSPIGIMLSLAKSQKTIMVNKAASDLLEYTEEELINLQVKEFTHPEDRKQTLTVLKQLKNGEKDKITVEKRYITKSGKTIWARTTVSIIRNLEGNAVYHLSTIEDVTREKKAKEKLIESENRLSSLILNLQAGILLEDMDGQVLLTNKMFCNLFGIEAPPEALIGMDCSMAAQSAKELFKDPDGFIDGINNLLKRKDPFLKEELELADGRFLERSYIPIFYEDEYQGRLWTYEDITLKKNYEKNLQEQKEKYSSVIANIDLGWVETDIEGKLVTANQSFCKFCGYTLEELMGQHVGDMLLAESSRHLLEKSRNKVFRGVIEPHELQIVTKKGDIRHLLVSAARSYDVDGKIIGTISIHLDVTEQKILEKQKESLLKSLEAQNEQLNEYAHMVSHDLKSPLRNISALISWTKEDFLGKLGEEATQNLDLIQGKIGKMDHLIENILKYSSIEGGSEQVEAVDLNILINDILGLIFVPDHIKVIVQKGLPTIKADTTKIQQLFQNLLSNAVNYMDKAEGLIKIGFEDKGTHHQFYVQDNGVGIKQEDFEKIFRIFKSLGNKENSTGIGLSIVKKVVELYKGEIWLESEFGKGTTFYFTIKKQR